MVRAEIALGRRTLTVDELAAVDVDENLAANAPGPQVATTDGGIVEAGDDGEVLDDSPTYTYHYEPAAQGGARYVRCEECGAESVPADPERVLHREDCSGATRRD